MSHPTPLAAPQAQAPKADLWAEAPAWRNLAVGAAVLTAVAIALPLMQVQSPNATASSGPVPASPTLPPAKPPAYAPVAQQPQSAPAPPKIVYVPAPRPASAPAPTSALAQAMPAQNTMACTLKAAVAPVPLGGGVVTAFEDRGVSQARIQLVERTAGGLIDPDYVDNLRVTVHLDSGQAQVLLVPKTMPVKIGDRVVAQGGYRNAQLPCNYIPNLITADLGPPRPTQTSGAASATNASLTPP